MSDRPLPPAGDPEHEAELRRRHLHVYGHLAERALAVHELEPHLLTGRQPLTELDVRDLARRGVTHVLDLRQEREWRGTGRHGADAVGAMPAYGIERLGLPVGDGEAPDGATLDLAVEFLDRAIGDGGAERKAYVHCRAGIERTGTVVLAYLAWRDRLPVSRALSGVSGGGHPYSPLSWQVDAVRHWIAGRQRSGAAKDV
jgi:rhodanese-related sulfurtransferase